MKYLHTNAFSTFHLLVEYNILYIDKLTKILEKKKKLWMHIKVMQICFLRQLHQFFFIQSFPRKNVDNCRIEISIAWKILYTSKLYIPSMYSKHWLSTMAHTIDFVRCKILNRGLNHGLLFSLFNFFGWKINLKIQDWNLDSYFV